MKKILDVLTSEFENSFEKCGYDGQELEQYMEFTKRIS